MNRRLSASIETRKDLVRESRNVVLLRMVPFVERNYYMVELGRFDA